MLCGCFQARNSLQLKAITNVTVLHRSFTAFHRLHRNKNPRPAFDMLCHPAFSSDVLPVVLQHLTIAEVLELAVVSRALRALVLASWPHAKPAVRAALVASQDNSLLLLNPLTGLYTRWVVPGQSALPLAYHWPHQPTAGWRRVVLTEPYAAVRRGGPGSPPARQWQ